MPNKLSEELAVLAKISPISASSATGSDWVSIKYARKLLALVQVGVMASSSTVDAKLQQATDNSGTGAKDVSGTSITQLTEAGTDDNKVVVINADSAEFDTNNDFEFCRLLITPATAASLISGVLIGGGGLRYSNTADIDHSSVDEIVN